MNPITKEPQRKKRNRPDDIIHSDSDMELDVKSINEDETLNLYSLGQFKVQKGD